MINFLHISDLHYDDNDKKQKDIITAFVDDVSKAYGDKNVDFVVFSGDLVRTPTEECFESVYEKFITPLMEQLKLAKDCFIYVPGNHEVQKLDEMAEKSREKSFDTIYRSANDLNGLIEDLLNGKSKEYVAKLYNYNNFSRRIYSVENATMIHEHNDICSVHYLKKANVQVGIACFNTCLSCFGKPSIESTNKIVFGKKQIEYAVEKIKNTEVKIAVFHHPLEWLSAYEIDVIQELLTKEFDIVLTGHNHADMARWKKRDKDSVLSNVAGYLYINSKPDSKYHFFSINIVDNKINIKGKINYRSYYPKKSHLMLIIQNTRMAKRLL